MFQIKNIELVHWDYWQRFSLPLNAQIITIVGPNGSGKTTLLDALRTLFALRCSGKRDFRRYVRRSESSFAWLRAELDNKASASGRRPFFPCLQDNITLACRIRKNGGEWSRDYTIADGIISIEELESWPDWLGLRDYQSRLAWGGLTPAIAKVLALEQGDTDKLCEYSPKALLELVFDVFGDKEVLDNYEAAREEQRNTERELEELETELNRIRQQAETRRIEAERYLEWHRLGDEISALQSEIIPRLEAATLAREALAQRTELQQIDSRRGDYLNTVRQARQALKNVAAEAAEAEQRRHHLINNNRDLESNYLAARDQLRDLEKLLGERDQLRVQVVAEHGQGTLKLEERHEAIDQELTGRRQEERLLLQEFEEKSTQLRQSRQKGAQPVDSDVAAFRQLLDKSSITHKTLAETIEITDAHWQGALEAILRPYRHVLLLSNDEQRRQAYQLGEAQGFRHFIISDTQNAGKATPGSLAEVIRFRGKIPSWIFELLNRIQRVEDSAAAAHLAADQEWITRNGYHKERRGARQLNRPHEFFFGELARKNRIEQLEADIARLDNRLGQLRPEIEALAREQSELRQKLLGLQSAQLLAANSQRYQHAEQSITEAKRHLQALGEERDACATELQTLNELLSGIAVETDRRTREQSTANEALEKMQGNITPQRQEQARRWHRLRALRRGMPAEWLETNTIAELDQQYGGLTGARREAERLSRRLAEGDWITDDTVLTLKTRLLTEVERREKDYADRNHYCRLAAKLTSDARDAYIAKLRATVRQYAKNLRQLGALAQIDVDCLLPPASEDELALNQTGLEVRFNFDKKGEVGLNDGEASGGQQVMKSLILLIALLMDETRPGGFVFIDEPFAHLDVANIERVGSFLRATRAQYLITTPVTHNASVFEPSELTLVTRKKTAQEHWAPPIGVLLRKQLQK